MRWDDVWELELCPEVMGKRGVSAGAQGALGGAEDVRKTLVLFGETKAVAGFAGNCGRRGQTVDEGKGPILPHADIVLHVRHGAEKGSAQREKESWGKRWLRLGSMRSSRRRQEVVVAEEGMGPEGYDGDGGGDGEGDG